MTSSLFPLSRLNLQPGFVRSFGRGSRKWNWKQSFTRRSRKSAWQTAVEALSGGFGAKRRAWVMPAILGLSVAVVLATLTTVLSNRHRRRDTLQLQAEVARLNGGIVQQGELLRRAESGTCLPGRQRSGQTREALKAQSQELRQKIADGGDSDGPALKKQLQETQVRLSRLETEARVAETIVQTYGSSICLLHVVVEFHDHDSGELIRISPDSAGKTQTDDAGMMSVETGGSGPPLQLDVFGTGFLVGDGRLLTNHHVAEPWWGSEGIQAAFGPGCVPVCRFLHRVFSGNVSRHHRSARPHFVACRPGYPQA